VGPPPTTKIFPRGFIWRLNISIHPS
jgi:hypothetical protein